MDKLGYTTTKNAGFFFPRYMAIIALDVAFTAWKGRQFLTQTNYLATLAATTLSFGAWSYIQRGYAHELAARTLDGNPADDESEAYMCANAFATLRVCWGTAGAFGALASLAYLVDRFAPHLFSPWFFGFVNGVDLTLGTVQLWHLCLKPKEK